MKTVEKAGVRSGTLAVDASKNNIPRSTDGDFFRLGAFQLVTAAGYRDNNSN
jgi:hypothetical protein